MESNAGALMRLVLPLLVVVGGWCSAIPCRSQAIVSGDTEHPAQPSPPGQTAGEAEPCAIRINLQFPSRSAIPQPADASEEPLGVNVVVLSVFSDGEGALSVAGIGESPVSVSDGAAEAARIENILAALTKELDRLAAAKPGRQRALMLQISADLRFQTLAKLLVGLAGKRDRPALSKFLLAVLPGADGASGAGWQVCSLGWDKSTLRESRLTLRIGADVRPAVTHGGAAAGAKGDNRSCRAEAADLATQAVKHARHARQIKAGTAELPVRLVIRADRNVPFAALHAVIGRFVQAGFRSVSLELSSTAADGGAEKLSPRGLAATREVALEIASPFPFEVGPPESLQRFKVGETPIVPAELNTAPLEFDKLDAKAGSGK